MILMIMIIVMMNVRVLTSGLVMIIESLLRLGGLVSLVGFWICRVITATRRSNQGEWQRRSEWRAVSVVMTVPVRMGVRMWMVMWVRVRRSVCRQGQGTPRHRTSQGSEYRRSRRCHRRTTHRCRRRVYPLLLLSPTTENIFIITTLSSLIKGTQQNVYVEILFFVGKTS